MQTGSLLSLTQSTATASPSCARRKWGGCWKRLALPIGRVLPRPGAILGSTPTWPMVDATAAVGSGFFAPHRPGSPGSRISRTTRAATTTPSMAASSAGSNRSARRSGAPPPGPDRDPAHLPVAVRPAHPGRAAARSLACRDASVPHRDAARPGGAADAGGHAPRRGRLGIGADGPPGERRERRNHDLRPRQAPARQLHPDRPARRRRWSTTAASTTA